MALCAVFCVACSSGSVTEETVLDEGDASIEEYGSLEDLPACTAKRADMLSRVSGVDYVCHSRSWKKVKAFVSSTCNVPSCSDKLDGSVYYAESSEEALQDVLMAIVNRNADNPMDFTPCLIVSV